MGESNKVPFWTVIKRRSILWPVILTEYRNGVFRDGGNTMLSLVLMLGLESCIKGMLFRLTGVVSLIITWTLALFSGAITSVRIHGVTAIYTKKSHCLLYMFHILQISLHFYTHTIIRIWNKHTFSLKYVHINFEKKKWKEYTLLL